MCTKVDGTKLGISWQTIGKRAEKGHFCQIKFARIV